MKRFNKIIISAVIFSLLCTFSGGIVTAPAKTTAASSQIIIASNPAASTDLNESGAVGDRNTYAKRLQMQNYPNNRWATRPVNNAGRNPLMGDGTTHRGTSAREVQFLTDTETLFRKDSTGEGRGRCKVNPDPTTEPVLFGNNFVEPGNLLSPFASAGGGQFVDEGSYGGWTMPNFNPSANGFTQAAVKTTSYSYLDPGSNDIYNSQFLSTHWNTYGIGLDQIDWTINGNKNDYWPFSQFPKYNCDPNNVWADHIFGGETVLFVRKFYINASTYNSMSSARFEGLTDDFSKAWINGVSLQRENTTTNESPKDPYFGSSSTPVNVNGVSDNGDLDVLSLGYLQQGWNTLAIQVTNKAHWEIATPDSEMTVSKVINGTYSSLYNTIAKNAESENPLSLYYRLFISTSSGGGMSCSLYSTNITGQPDKFQIAWAGTGITRVGNPGPYAWTAKTTAVGTETVTQTEASKTYTLKGYDSGGNSVDCDPVSINKGASLTCTANPTSGTIPFVVEITASGGAGTYTFNVDEDGYIVSGRPSPIYYTYKKAGDHTITVSDNSGSAPCNVVVNAATPKTDTGGEVAP